jgi:NADH:ubiquinone oxidoreductase subunit H
VPDVLLSSLYKAGLLVGLAVVFYPPLAFLDRWAQVPPGERAALPKNPLLPIANALKLLTKRSALPGSADRWVHVVAPFFTLMPGMLALACLPLGPRFESGSGASWLGVTQGSGVSVAVPLGFLMMSTFGIAAAGWAGANRLALLGALRLALLRTAALVVLALGALGVSLIHRTGELDALVLAQARDLMGDIPAHGAIINPVGFVCAIIALATLGQRMLRSRPDERADLVEAYAAEASGPTLLGHRLFEVLELLVQAGLVATIFFGGWAVPGTDTDGSVVPMGTALGRLAFLGAKTLVAAGLLLVVRRALPPLRHDQALSLVWVLLPVTAAGLALSAILFARFTL